MMKKIASALLVTSIAINSYSQQKNFIDQPYIEISGYADSLVIPNEIFIRISISVTEKEAREKITVASIEAKMIEGLTALGLDTEKFLATFDFGSNYRFYAFRQRDVLRTKQYFLKVTDVVMTGKVFMLMEDLGIPDVAVERVDHSQIDQIKNITRIKASEDAKQKAVALSKPLGQSVGPAIFLTDNEAATTLGTPITGKVPGVVVRGYGKGKESEAPKIAFEKIKVSTTVTARFILK